MRGGQLRQCGRLVLAGRSLWKDCLRADRQATAQTLRERAVPRLRELQAVLAEMPA